MEDFESGKPNQVWDMGERIALGLLKANGVLRVYRTAELQDQHGEIDMMWDWREDGNDYHTAYEIKTDCAAFCRKSKWKNLNRAVQYVERYTGRVLDWTLGTGNVFIELVQRMPKCLWEKVQGKTPLTDVELKNINEILRKEPGMENKFARGWMQIIRENKLETTPGRFVWFVLPMPYDKGRCILIIAIPDEELIRIENEKKRKGSIRYAYTIEKDKEGNEKLSWGWLLPLSELFQFAVKDETLVDPTPERNSISTWGKSRDSRAKC